MSEITVKPAVGGDDGYDDRGTFNATDNNVKIGNVSGVIASFFRCANVTIPKKAKIVSAVLNLTNDNTRSSAVELYVKAAAADNQAAPTSSGGLGSIPRTTASSSLWSFSTSGVTTYTSPDISSVIQEVVDRAGWVSGNALMIIVEGSATTNRYAYVYSFEGNSQLCGNLVVTYLTESGVPAVFISDFGVI